VWQRSALEQLLNGGEPRDVLLNLGVLACLVVTVGSFFAAQPLLDLAEKAVLSL